MWSFVILHYIFCQLQGGSFKTLFCRFMNAKWDSYILGLHLGPWDGLAFFKQEPTRVSIKTLRIVNSQDIWRAPRGHPNIIKRLQMNNCVLYTKWLWMKTEKHIFLNSPLWVGCNFWDCCKLVRAHFFPHICHTNSGKESRKISELLLIIL